MSRTKVSLPTHRTVVVRRLQFCLLTSPFMPPSPGSLQMEAELERFHKQNTQLELNITELLQKLRATDQEMRKEQQKVRGFQSLAVRGLRIWHLPATGSWLLETEPAIAKKHFPF